MKKRIRIVLVAAAVLCAWITAGYTVWLRFAAPLAMPVERTALYRKSNDYQKDFLWLADFLRTTHPAGKKTYSGTEWKQRWVQLHTELETADETVWKMALMETVALLGDSHTGFSFGDDIAGSSGVYAPVQFGIYDSRLFVTRASPGIDRSVLNLEVESVHGRPVQDLIAEACRWYGCENDLIALGRIAGVLNGEGRKDLARARLFGLIPEADRFEFTAGGRDWLLPLVRSPLYTGSERSLHPLTRPRSDLFYYGYVDEATAYFQLNSMLVDHSFAYPYFESFFAEITQRGVRNLIVDLRNNGGGYSTTGFLFQSFLEKDRPGNSWRWWHRNSDFTRRINPALIFASNNSMETRLLGRLAIGGRERRFSGPVYVLIGNNTYSAATIWSGSLIDNDQYIVVGEPSAQKPDFYASVWPFQLPVSRFTGQISTGQHLRPDRTRKDDPVLYPQVHIPLLPEDVMAGRDPVLDWVLDDIAKQMF